MTEEQKRQFFYEFAQGAYSGIKDTLSNLDNKINNLFTLNAGLITVVTGLTYFIVQYLLLNGKYSPVLLTPVAFSLFCFVASVVLGVVAYAPAERGVVEPEELMVELRNETYLRVLSRAAATISYAARVNSDLATRKSRRVRWMSWLLSGGLGLAVLGFIIFFIALGSSAH